MPALGWISLALAAAAVLCVALPAPGGLVAMGLAIFAVASGMVGYRRRSDPGAPRLAGAGAVALGAIALLLAATRYGLTLAVLRRVETLF
jgi:hypothetical protein